MKEQERPLGFVLERTLNFTFPCFATVRAASLARWCARYLQSGSALESSRVQGFKCSEHASPARHTHPPLDVLLLDATHAPNPVPRGDAQVHFAERLGVAPLELQYFTQMDAAQASVRVVADMPSSLGKAARKHRGPTAVFDPTRGDGWVAYTPEGTSAAVRYNVVRAATEGGGSSGAQASAGVETHMRKTVSERLRK